MQTFTMAGAPQAKVGDRRVCTETADLFVNAEQGKQVIDALFDRKVPVLKGVADLTRLLSPDKGLRGQENDKDCVFHFNSVVR
jgi:hypothetical protein